MRKTKTHKPGSVKDCAVCAGQRTRIARLERDVVEACKREEICDADMRRLKPYSPKWRRLNAELDAACADRMIATRELIAIDEDRRLQDAEKEKGK